MFNHFYSPSFFEAQRSIIKAIHIVYIIHQEGLGSNAQALLIGS